MLPPTVVLWGQVRLSVKLHSPGYGYVLHWLTSILVLLTSSAYNCEYYLTNIALEYRVSLRFMLSYFRSKERRREVELITHQPMSYRIKQLYFMTFMGLTTISWSEPRIS